MTLSQYTKILYEYFGDRIFIDAYELRKNKHNNADVFKNILSKFIIEDDSSFILLESKTDDYINKLYNGREILPVFDAINIKSRMDFDTFNDFYEQAELPTDQISSLVNSFKNHDIIIDINNVEKNLFDILEAILNEIINKDKKISIRKAEIVGDVVKVGNKSFKLNKKLISDNVHNNNSKYIDALIKVYTQDSNIEISSTSEIEKLPILYQKHLKIQKESFFSAECVLHQIRDAFSDGELEFNCFKDEIYEAIEDHLIKKYKNGFHRVQKVLEIVIIANVSKSFLSNHNNGLIGPKEKKGIVHMLVNDGQIEWITDYDENI